MKVLFATKDIGGFECILPIINEVESDKLIVASAFAKERLSKEGIDYLDSDTIEFSELVKQISSFKPDIIVTGTSFGLSIEKKIIEYGNEKEIPSLSVVDYWSNYFVRFVHEEKKYFPTRICAIDELMKNEMINDNIDPQKIAITGNPAFDNLRINISECNNNKVLFLSQPFSELEDFEENEFNVLEDIICEVAKLKKEGLAIDVIAKPHPRAKIGKFDKYSDAIKIDNNNEYKFEDVKVVIGMSTMGLFYASLVNKNIISYQPKATKEDCILSKLKIISTIKEKSDLKKKIREALNDNLKIDITKLEQYINKNATKKILNLIEELSK